MKIISKWARFESTTLDLAWKASGITTWPNSPVSTVLFASLFCSCDFVQAKCKDITLDQAYDGQCRKTYMNVIELLIAENKVSGGVTKTSLPVSRKNVVQSTTSPASVPTRPGSLLTRPGSSIISEANFKTGSTSPTVMRSATSPPCSTKKSEGREFCDIGYVCPDTLFPVCGSNGVFYLNM